MLCQLYMIYREYSLAVHYDRVIRYWTIDRSVPLANRLTRYDPTARSLRRGLVSRPAGYRHDDPRWASSFSRTRDAPQTGEGQQRLRHV
jgi:hypothetical protein